MKLQNSQYMAGATGLGLIVLIMAWSLWTQRQAVLIDVRDGADERRVMAILSDLEAARRSAQHAKVSALPSDERTSMEAWERKMDSCVPDAASQRLIDYKLEHLGDDPPTRNADAHGLLVAAEVACAQDMLDVVTIANPQGAASVLTLAVAVGYVVK